MDSGKNLNQNNNQKISLDTNGIKSIEEDFIKHIVLSINTNDVEAFQVSLDSYRNIMEKELNLSQFRLKQGQTLLHESASKGHIKIFEKLIKSITSQNKNKNYLKQFLINTYNKDGKNIIEVSKLEILILLAKLDIYTIPETVKFIKDSKNIKEKVVEEKNCDTNNENDEQKFDNRNYFLDNDEKVNVSEVDNHTTEALKKLPIPLSSIYIIDGLNIEFECYSQVYNESNNVKICSLNLKKIWYPIGFGTDFMGINLVSLNDACNMASCRECKNKIIATNRLRFRNCKYKLSNFIDCLDFDNNNNKEFNEIAQKKDHIIKKFLNEWKYVTIVRL